MGPDSRAERRVLLNNAGYLYVVQGANYLLPLLTVPYLVRVLGPARFGLLAFAQAFVQYFVVVTEYGFALSASRRAAICRDDRAVLARLYSSVLVAKTFLMVLCLAVLLSVVGAVPAFRTEWQVYVATFPLVVANVLQPVWLFQGLEDLRPVTVASLVGKIAAVVAIFVVVRRQSDYVLAALIPPLGSLLTALLATWWLHARHRLGWFQPARSEVAAAVKDGWHLFLSTAAINLYTGTTVFLLGLLTSNRIVGEFSAAEKVVRAVEGLLYPFSKALYPRLAVLVTRARSEAIAFIQMVGRWVAGVSLAASVLLLVFAGPVVHLVLGAQYEAAVTILRWLAPLPFLIALSNLYGIQTMLTFGYQRPLSRILLGAGLLNLLLVVPLVALFQGSGAALSMLLTEAAVTLATALFVRARGIPVLRRRRAEAS